MEPLVRDLADLVAFETVSRLDPDGAPLPAGRPLEELTAWVAERFEGTGMNVAVHAHPHDPSKRNVVARAGPQGTDGLVLSGHMDVVPTEGQPWTGDPFRLREVDGRLIGRGTADMKGFLAATLHAVRAAPRSLRRELVLVWTYDEEVGCLGAGHLVDDGALGPLPSACVIGEPTDFQILRMHPGHVEVEVEVRGRAAHSSRPWLGVNAIEAAAAVVEVVRGLADDLRGEPDGDGRVTPLQVGRIHGGAAVNIVPDAVTLRIGYRPLPGAPVDAVMRRLEERLADLPRPHTGLVTRLVRVTPSLHTPAGTPLEGLLRAHARHDEVGCATFATDGGQLARAGTSPLVFGPGSIAVAHRADEHVDAADLHRAVDVIGALIRARCVDAA